MKKRERQRWRYRRIKKALKKINGPGLMAIDAPIYDENGDIVAWDTLTKKDDVHQRIMDRNNKHLSQATDTPFGDGEGYEKLNGEDKNQIFEKNTARKL